MYDSYNNIPINNTFGINTMSQGASLDEAYKRDNKKRIQYEYFKGYINSLSEDEAYKRDNKKRIQYEYFKGYINSLSEDELYKERQVTNMESSHFYKCDHDSFDYKSYRILLQDRYIQVKVLSRFFSVF